MKWRVALVGAGYISDFHLEALKSVPAAEVVAVVDSNLARAQKLARTWSIPCCLESVNALIAERIADVAHVLVPPDLHRAVSEPLLRAGIHVLLEKPMAVTAADCAALNAAATTGGAMLGVNQNFVFLTALTEAKRLLGAHHIGNLQQVQCWFNLPIRQMLAGQFGHWMFRLPQNILLEQAVHPLSQLIELIGTPRKIDTTIGAPMEIGVDQQFYPTWTVALTGERANAQAYFGFGRDFPAWGMLLIGEDGAIQLDCLASRLTIQTKTKWPDFFDRFTNGWTIGWQLCRQSVSGLASHLLSLLKLRPRSDVFMQTMCGSISAFYEGLGNGRLPVDGRFGARLVEICETMAAPVLASTPASSAPVIDDGRDDDVTIIGGTGFIGRHTVAALLAAGRRVRVMARNMRPVPRVLADPRVTLIPGDTSRREDVARAIGNSKLVIDLAHGGGGSNYAEVENAMVGGMRCVAETCAARQVRRLVYVSSIAALYLGENGATVVDNIAPDPQGERRADYSRAKGVAERALLDLARARGLSVVIMRPGVVVGEGGIPFHSGLGLFNSDTHCLGWNRGENPLPFVLVEDCAAALVKALNPDVADGRSYNLVGDVRLTAREYVAELAQALGRPIRFHAQMPQFIQTVEAVKWLVKRINGRNVPFPSYRDILSQGMQASFDCSEAKQHLGWQPVADRARFIERAIKVLSPRG